MSPERFGPYQLIELIGSGGMGEVYRAVDTRKDRVVALKRLPARLSADSRFVDRFRRESALAAQLHNPHIIPIHDYGHINGQPYLDMRLVDGIDLATTLREEGSIGPVRASAILDQVADALDSAHTGGLIHRDIKPANVLLSRSATPRGYSAGDHTDFVYLIDFGIAANVNATRITSTGTTVGTAAYMAPERFTESGADHRVDIYSLGCLLYELLAGSLPFDGDFVQLMYAHLQSPPPRISLQTTRAPRGMDEVIARAMAKNAASRFASAGEMAGAVRAILSRPARTVVDVGPPALQPPGLQVHGPTSPKPPSVRPLPPSTPPPWSPSPDDPAPYPGTVRGRPVPKPTIAVASMVVVLAAVVAVIAFGRSPSSLPPAPSNAPSTPRGAAQSLSALGIDLRGQTYTVGGKNFDEQLFLCKAQIAALQSVGAQVNDRCNIQGTAAARTAITTGQIDMYWEYTGTGWITNLKRTPPIQDSQGQYLAVKEADLANDIVWTDPTPFNNTYAIGTTKALADRYGLKTTTDFANFVNSGNAGAGLCVESEFAVRPDGLPGLKETYGITAPLRTSTLDTGAIYKATADGQQCRFGEVFTTDGRIPGLNLVALADDKNYFPKYNASNTIRKEVADRNPGVVTVSNEIAKRLNYDTILRLNGAILSDGQDPDFVARNWLKQQGLIGQ